MISTLYRNLSLQVPNHIQPLPPSICTKPDALESLRLEAPLLLSPEHLDKELITQLRIASSVSGSSACCRVCLHLREPQCGLLTNPLACVLDSFKAAQEEIHTPALNKGYHLLS